VRKKNNGREKTGGGKNRDFRANGREGSGWEEGRLIALELLPWGTLWEIRAKEEKDEKKW